MKYIKGNFLSHRMYVDDGILNGSCLEWLERTANAKVHGTTIPVDDPKYHVTTQKRPLAAYAKAGGSSC